MLLWMVLEECVGNWWKQHRQSTRAVAHPATIGGYTATMRKRVESLPIAFVVSRAELLSDLEARQGSDDMSSQSSIVSPHAELGRPSAEWQEVLNSDLN